MANNNQIEAIEIQETEFGEKLVIDSPYEAKEYIDALPWKETTEEISEHGSLEAKLASRDVSDSAIEKAVDFGFSDDFSAHASWNPTAIGGEDGAWMIDVDAWDEASEFFEYCGFDTTTRSGVNL